MFYFKFKDIYTLFYFIKKRNLFKIFKVLLSMVASRKTVFILVASGFKIIRFNILIFSTCPAHVQHKVIKKMFFNDFKKLEI